MDVRALIEKLKGMPSTAAVGMLTDGGHGHDVELVYLAKSGVVMVAPFGAHVYDDADAPQDFPPRAEGQLLHLLPEHD